MPASTTAAGHPRAPRGSGSESRMEQPGAARRRRGRPRVPGVQADVMVVAAGGDEGRFIAQPLLQLEAEHAAVEVERAVDVRHFEVDVADVDAGVDRRGGAGRDRLLDTRVDRRAVLRAGGSATAPPARAPAFGRSPRRPVEHLVDEPVGAGVVVPPDMPDGPAGEGHERLHDFGVQPAQVQRPSPCIRPSPGGRSARSPRRAQPPPRRAPPLAGCPAAGRGTRPRCWWRGRSVRACSSSTVPSALWITAATAAGPGLPLDPPSTLITSFFTLCRRCV